jgi:hypothetical protein
LERVSEHSRKPDGVVDFHVGAVVAEIAGDVSASRTCGKFVEILKWI